MKIYDISMTISNDMAVWKNREEKKPNIALVRTMPQDAVNESQILMNLHTGTHIDAPFHVSANGTKTEDYALDDLITECQVLDLLNVKDGITIDDLQEKNIKEGGFVLLKTNNSLNENFEHNFTFLTASGAEYLLKKKIKGVGIDALGIERSQEGHLTHHILLDNGIIIIEGLRLKEINAGFYKMCALPLKIKNVEGAPARVILIEN